MDTLKIVSCDFLRSKKKISSSQLVNFAKAHTPACILLQFRRKSDCETLDDITVALGYYVNSAVRTGKPMGYLTGNSSRLKSTFHSEGWFIAIRDRLVKDLHTISLSDFERVCDGLKPLGEVIDDANSMDFTDSVDLGYVPIEPLKTYLSVVSNLKVCPMDDFECEIIEEGQRVWNLAQCLDDAFGTTGSSEKFVSLLFPLSPLMSVVDVHPKIPYGVSFFRKAPKIPLWEDSPGQFFCPMWYWGSMVWISGICQRWWPDG